MELKRIFYPVGQGIFYTEKFHFGDKVFNVVFDCGSENKNKIEKEISQTFTKEDTIDILFISHFHADHMNSLNYLKKHCKQIKRVVIPFQTEESVNLIKIVNPVQYNINKQVLKFLKQEGIEIINVIEYDKDKEIESEDKKTLVIDLAEESTDGKEKNLNSRDRNSGDVIEIRNNTDYWEYIVYNFDISKCDSFIDELKQKLNLSNKEEVKKKLKEFDFTNTKQKEIKQVYEKVFGKKNLNNSSLVVLSLPKAVTKKTNNYFHIDIPYLTYPFFHRLNPLPSTYIGFVFTGDFNAKKFFDDNIEKSFYSDENKKLIGMIQVPHHGSIHSHNDKFILPNIIYPISFGNNNKYGHPSKVVLANILSKGGVPCFIAENSTLIQIIE